jgi:hypothetical protein
MSVAGRRRAFLLASLAVAVAAALSTLFLSPPKESTRPSGEPQAPAAQSDARPVLPPRVPAQAPPRATEPPNPRSGRRDARVAEIQARRFLMAFIRYQRGRVDAATRRTLIATASPRLVRQLRDRPPRDADRAQPARLARIAIYGPWRGRVKATAVLAYHGASDPSLLEFALQRGRGEWRVVELYP